MALLDEVRWFPGAARLVDLARPEMPQQKSESAAFVTLVSLRAHGIPVTSQDDTASAGSSPASTAAAIAELSGGELTAVVAEGAWTAAALRAILAGVPELDVTLVAFVDTADLGAPDTPDRALRDYLDGGLPPFWSSRWRTRNPVFLAGTVSGPGGTLVAIVDGYRSAGRDGVHLQMLDRVVAALRGLLLVVPAADAPAALALVARARLTP
ncbi:hypothetical protein GCM10017786_59670 [Amycolatopsis deserti]|uniref:Uncharacterized protein n=1 Tax=Amycolatopsis deserti TaxID=185696 RepID=A0ABQ3JB75_9PSEU|nr:hypothetical protein GCM10017786_59670 [Amycolatopsis deserti]